MAKGQERNPFVLVLVDGDGYIFDDDLISSGGEGGSRAAGLLNNSIKSSLRARGLEHCKILVRVYANLAGLSKAVSKAKLCGAEKRSLAPFVAGFNRSNELFDFVDAGELKENADFKLRGMFRQFAEASQCKHVYFAACHDVGYVSELIPYTSSRERITLLRSYAFHPEFAKLGLRVEDLPGIFRTKPLPSDVGPYVKPAATTPASPTSYTNHNSAPSSDQSAPSVCTFFQIGKCRYGKTCKHLHVMSGATNGHSKDLSSDKQGPWRSETTSKYSWGPNPVEVSSEFAQTLPREEDVPPGKVPVNKYQQRLDPYIPPASAEERSEFQRRIAKRKLCNNYHLSATCTQGNSCEYDHSAITTITKDCLKYVAQSMPCPRRSTCRSLTCSHGHICQKPDCKFRGGKTFCKLPVQLHTIDMHVDEYVAGTKHSKDVSGEGDDGAMADDGIDLTPPSPSIDQDDFEDCETGPNRSKGVSVDSAETNDDF